MKSLTRHLTFTVPARMDFLNITADVQQAVEESGVAEGLVLVNAMHITASVFINDNESGLARRLRKRWLEELVPFNPGSDLGRRTAICTTARARTTPTLTTNARSWAARLSWRSPRAASTLAPGNRSSMANSTADGRNG